MKPQATISLLLMTYEFLSPLKDPNNLDNLSSADAILHFTKCCKTSINIPSKFRNNHAVIFNHIA